MNTEFNSSLQKLLHYKRWANKIVFNFMLELPEEELLKKRLTCFGSILHTLNHVFVIDDVFKAHLNGSRHSYTERNTDTPAPLDILWQMQQEIDEWYIAHLSSLHRDKLKESLEFEFIGGGTSNMTREDMFIHVVNHATYHQGYVSDMCYQIPVTPPATDFTVFLRSAQNVTATLSSKV